MKTSHIILLVIIAVAIGVIVSLMSDTRTYTDFKTAALNPETNFDIVGILDTTSIQYDAKINPDKFLFKMTDDSGTVMEVVCYKPKPQNFEHSKKVVISGNMKDGKFHATNVLLKCPSKYESEGKPSEFAEKTL